MSDSCYWEGVTAIVAIIGTITGWGSAAWLWRVTRRDKTVEHIGSALADIGTFDAELTKLLHDFAPYASRKDYISTRSVELQIEAGIKYHEFFNTLETFCFKVNYGVIDKDVVKNQLAPNLEQYARLQIGMHKILAEIARQTGRPFNTGQSSKTYQNFYRVVSEHVPAKVWMKLNEERTACGLPSVYNRPDK
ncbi:MAG: hypothetical protein HYX59_09905 [Elusimicrobia bacterium]|nr:hypothetical protein [Elusimicrobiota bacterium]